MLWYGQLTAPKPDSTAITVTPITPIRDTPCSMVKIPCETLSSGNGSPIFQSPYRNTNQQSTVNIRTALSDTEVVCKAK